MASIPLLAVAIAIALGAALGVVNGVIVAWGRVPAVVVTLGTLAIYRGVLVDLSGAKTVTTDSLPQWLIDLPLVNVAPIGGLDIRALFILALVIVIVFQVGTTYLSFARRFYAIGSNPEAAQLIGLPIKGVVFAAFVICGALSGLGGFMLLARFGNITVEAGRGLELSVVAAVVVGGVNVFGGSGTVSGAMLGAVMIGTLEQSLFRLGISEFWLDAVLGLLILLAVASDAGHPAAPAPALGRRGVEAGHEGSGVGFRERRVAVMSALERLKGWETMMLALLVAIVVFNSVGSPYFLSVGNFVNLFQLSIEKSIVALTMALIIIGGEIDLSVASVMGLSACVMAWTFHQGAPMPLAILIALAAGILAGLNNAFWIARVGLPSLAVTLAGLIGYRGIARILLEDRAIGGFPAWFNTLGQQALIGPLTAAISIFFVLFRLLCNCAARLCFRSSRLCRGQQRSGGALFRRAGRIGQGELVRRLCFCGGARGNPLCRATGICARRHGGGLRARRHHRRAFGRGQHFRRQGQPGRRRPRAACNLEPSQRNGACRHHRQHPELRDRGASHPLGIDPEYVARPKQQMERERNVTKLLMGAAALAMLAALPQGALAQDATATPGQAVSAVLLPKFLGILPFDQAHKGAEEAAKELRRIRQRSSSSVRRRRTASPDRSKSSPTPRPRASRRS